MKKPQKFKPSCPWIKKEMANAKRAGSARYFLGSSAVGASGSIGGFSVSFGRSDKIKAEKLVIYAAALGQKQGILPVDMSKWAGSACWSGDAGVVSFSQAGSPFDPVKIPVRFLEWSPAEPIEEIIEPEADQFLMAA